MANRKRSRQLETGGLVVTKAVYGSPKGLGNRNQPEEATDDNTSQIIDVTLPLNFLVNDSGQVKVCFCINPMIVILSCFPMLGSLQLFQLLLLPFHIAFTRIRVFCIFLR